MSEALIEKVEWLCSTYDYEWFKLPDWVKDKCREGKFIFRDGSVTVINPDGETLDAEGSKWLSCVDGVVEVVEEQEMMDRLGITPLPEEK